MTTYSGVNTSVYYIAVERQPQTFFQTGSRTSKQGKSSSIFIPINMKIKKKEKNYKII